MLGRRVGYIMIILLIGLLSAPTAGEEVHTALIDFRQGLSGWTSFGAVAIPNNQDGYDDAHSLQVIDRSASWNGALYELDGKLTPGGAYRFSVQVKLAPGEPEAAANITLRQIEHSGEASFRWLTESV